MFRLFKFLLVLQLAGAVGHGVYAAPWGQWWKATVAAADQLVPAAFAAPAIHGNSTVEVAFSPRQGAEDLIVKVIGSAQQEIRLQAYSFTSATVVKALLAAHKRGVDVQLVVDHKNNVVEDRSGKAKAALNTLVLAGIPVRTIDAYAIHHDKVIVVDRRHVQTGSYNYSAAAATRNSENVLVMWNNPDVAATYLGHWQSRWKQGQAFRGGI